MTYRERAEHALGHPLPPFAVVHHHSYEGNRSQLVICQDLAYHALLHRRMRARGLKSRRTPRRLVKIIHRSAFDQASRGSGHTAYPARLLIRLSRALLQRVNRAAAEKGQPASTYVRLALVDALQRDKQPEKAVDGQ